MNSYQVLKHSFSHILREDQNILASNHGTNRMDMTSSLRDDPILKHLLLDGQSFHTSDFRNLSVDYDMTNSLRDDPILKHFLIDGPSHQPQPQHRPITPHSYQRGFEIPSGTAAEYDFNTPSNDVSVTSWLTETDEQPAQMRSPPPSFIDLCQRISQQYQTGVFQDPPSGRMSGTQETFDDEGDYIPGRETRSSSVESEDQDVIRIYPIEVEETPILEIHLAESLTNSNLST